MPIWSTIAGDIGKIAKQPGGAEQALLHCDRILQNSLQGIANRDPNKKRNVILYVSAAFHKDCNDRASIHPVDMQAMMTVVSGLDRSLELDFIIHSGGGSAEVAAGLIQYLRTRFPYIRAFVPQLAMSAATLFCFGCNKIVMGDHSAIGPIDPQIRVGNQFMPAHAIITQYDKSQAEIQKDPAMSGFYGALLPAYTPGLVEICRNLTALSKTFAEQWLKDYMFAGHADAATKAHDIAEYFGDHGNFQSHSKHVFRPEALAKKLVVERLEDDNALQDNVLTAYHAATISLKMTSAMKYVANQNGVKYSAN